MNKLPVKSILPLLCLAVSAAGIFVYVTRNPPVPPENHVLRDRSVMEAHTTLVTYGYPLVGAVLIAWIVSNQLTLSRRVRRLRLLKDGSVGRPPRDGSVIAVAGELTADSGPVTTPAGRTSCIAYYYYVRQRTSRKLDYYGYALTPVSINSPFGKVRVLAVPEIDLLSRPGKTYDDVDSTGNFKNYFHNTKFARNLVGSPPLAKECNLPMTDRTNPIKADVKMSLGSRVPDDFDVTEHCLDEGEMVSALGTYSASQQGLVHDPESAERHPIKIERGPIDRLVKEELSSVVGNVVGTACLLAILSAMVWAYRNLYSTLESLSNLTGVGT